MLLWQFKIEKVRKLRKIVSLIIVKQGYYGVSETDWSTVGL